MARETLTLCDFNHSDGRRPATTYRLWCDGATKARTVDLCDEHAEPLLAIFKDAQEVELPTKPRRSMEVTKLVTTAKTAPLKKR